MPEPVSVAHVVDELLSEGHADAGGDRARIETLGRALATHARTPGALAAHRERLRAALAEASPFAAPLIRIALAEDVLSSDEPDLADVLDSAARLALLDVAHLATRAPSTALLERFAAWAGTGDATVRRRVCLFLGRSAARGYRYPSFVPALLAWLADKGSGRGGARVDVGRDAAVTLASYVSADSAVRARVEALAAGRGTAAANARRALDQAS